MVGEDITVLTNPRESSCLEHVPNEPWYPKDVEAWSVRWVVMHLIEETAGHADIVRESIDGATSYALMAGAEGWPETPWIKPWTPAATTTS